MAVKSGYAANSFSTKTGRHRSFSKCSGAREYCAHVNGVFASEQTPNEETDLHFAVSTGAVAKALKAGTNVIAIRLEARSAAGPLRFSVGHCPDAE